MFTTSVYFCLTGVQFLQVFALFRWSREGTVEKYCTIQVFTYWRLVFNTSVYFCLTGVQFLQVFALFRWSREGMVEKTGHPYSHKKKLSFEDMRNWTFQYKCSLFTGVKILQVFALCRWSRESVVEKTGHPLMAIMTDALGRGSVHYELCNSCWSPTGLSVVRPPSREGHCVTFSQLLIGFTQSAARALIRKGWHCLVRQCHGCDNMRLNL